MSDQRDMAVTAVRVRVWCGGKFPMLHRTRTRFSPTPEWAPPGGHVEDGETPKQAARRELRQELGINVEERDLRHVHTQYRARHDAIGARVDLYYDVDRFTGEVANAEPEQHDRLEWFGPRELPAATAPHILHALDAIARGESESGLDLAWLERHGYVPKKEEREGGPA